MTDNLEVVYQDRDLLIINKPAGIIVNRSDTTSGQLTLQDLIERENKIDKNDTDPTFTQRSGIVHRLDKETSGLIIVAKNSKAFVALQKEFADRLVKKSYVALVHGEIKPKNGEISVPVGRLPWNRKRFGVLAGGRPSITKYETVDVFEKNGEMLSLVRLFPKTGRTHQIRVHMKYINHPIFSDFLYGGRKTARNDRKILPRVFLHAESISFVHPMTKKEVSSKIDLPLQLTEVLETFKSKKDNK